MNTSQETLIKAGLGPYESEVYTILVDLGESLTPAILDRTSLSRATVYAALASLLEKQFLEYRKDGRNAYYSPAHPSKLLALLDDKKRELHVLEEEASLAVEGLIAHYNVTKNKPGVRFFVGDDMAKKVFLEHAKAEEVVYSITNRDAFEQASPKLLAEDAKSRQKTAIYERVIVADTPRGQALAKAAQADPFLDVKILPAAHSDFAAGMDMYDGKIIYGTHKKTDTITAVIEDADLCRMQRHIFEVLWDLL